MIKKRKAQGCITQAQVIYETETTYLIRDNIVPVVDENGVELENMVKYDEYVIEKHNFPMLQRLAIANFPPINENEQVVFEILREQNIKENS